MSCLCSWVVNFLPIPSSDMRHYLNLFVVGGSFSNTVSVCNPLNLFVMGGRSFPMRSLPIH